MPLEKAEYLILNEIEAAAILKETGAALAENADGTALLNGLVHKFPDSKIVLTSAKKVPCMAITPNAAHRAFSR